MSNGMRPGGLTALAVMNFVFAAFMALSGIVWLSKLVLFSGAFSLGGDTPQAREMERMMSVVKEAYEKAGGIPFILLVAAFCFILAVLLIISGVGYLKQRKFGRILGNVYVATAVLYVAIVVGSLPSEVGGFDHMTMITLIYPVLTLVVLNTTFRRDFGS